MQLPILAQHEGPFFGLGAGSGAEIVSFGLTGIFVGPGGGLEGVPMTEEFMSCLGVCTTRNLLCNGVYGIPDVRSLMAQHFKRLFLKFKQRKSTIR